MKFNVIYLFNCHRYVKLLIATIHLFSGDRKLLKDFVDILEPFRIATKMMEGDTGTSSDVILVIKDLKDRLSNLAKVHKSDLLTALQNSVNDRLQRYESMDLFILATALDPRYKLTWTESTGEFNEYRNMMLSELRRQPLAKDLSHQYVTTPHPNNKKKFSSDSIGRFLNKHSVPKISSVEEELNRYLDTDPHPLASDPLSYWKANKELYPTLSNMAKKYLIIVSSSAPVERVFSHCGKVFRPDRCQLSDSLFSYVMNIKLNSDTL